MPGPPPKDPTERRRRNRPDEFDVLPAGGYRGKVPVKLPAAYRVEESTIEPDPDTGRNFKRTDVVERKFLAATKAWFKVWATSPQATMFTGTDWQRLLMLAPLVDQFHRSGSKDLAAEIRQQEAGLGATWADRQRLRVRIAADDDAATPSAAPAPASTARRARLRAVS